MRIRLAVEAWDRFQTAGSFDSANAGVRIPWVEIDGRPVDGVISAKVKQDSGIQMVTLKAAALVEIVAVDHYGNPLTEETVHRCPPVGEGLTPCCGRTPFELLRTDRITIDDDLVTCRARR